MASATHRRRNDNRHDARRGAHITAIGATVCYALFLFAPEVPLRTIGLWALVGLGSLWVLTDAWRENREK